MILASLIVGAREWLLPAALLAAISTLVVVSAYWRDYLGDLHETPAILEGAKNVSRFNVPRPHEL